MPPGSRPARRASALLGLAVLAVVAFSLPAPPGLTQTGWAALLVMAVSVALWTSGLLPTGATALAAVVLLSLTNATPNLQSALSGFARPTVFFLLGVLTLGVAALQSGLAGRVASVLVVAARGRANLFYTQMVAAFALLALLLPSASTRGAILLPVYEQALDRLLVPTGAPLRVATMLGLASLNRLGSNALLTGGITPVVAAGLIGGFSWTSWLLFMGVPVYLLLLLGGAAVYLLTRPARTRLPPAELKRVASPLTVAERKTLLIATGVSALWMTDTLHHWDPAIPALVGAVALLTPGLGVLHWSDLERGLGWVNLLVIAASLSLAQAMTSSGAAAWLANLLRLGAGPLTGHPIALAATLVCACLVLRLVLPNIAAYLSLLIPVVMQLAPDVGLNPLVCAMLVTVAGDSVLYYPAQSASSLMVAERGHLRPGPVFGLAAIMALLVLAVLMLLAIPWWSWLGQPLAAA